MPEVTIGFCGSNGMPFLLQVMCGAVERSLGRLAGEALRRQIDQHQVVVGAAGDKLVAAGEDRLRHRLGVGDHGMRVSLELGRQRLVKRRPPWRR